MRKNPKAVGTKNKERTPALLDRAKERRITTFTDNYDLPAGYHTTAITLIARDPHWIHAYWEITPPSIEEVRNKIGSQLGSFSYVLRMYDVTFIDFNGNNANHWFDIDVGPHANNWYINLWHDNVTYCADIGIRTPEGRFFTLARSNFVTTPRVGQSGRFDSIWMDVKDGQNKPSFTEIKIEKQYRKGSRSGTKAGRRKIFLTEDDIKAYYSKLFPLLRKVIKTRYTRDGTPRGADLLGVHLKDGIVLDDVLVRDLPRGASELLKKEGASEREEKKRGFFFEIGTELIVYGRTEPDAEVWLGDKKMKLRSDGTFTLRFALPEGKVPLNFTASSRDKTAKRTIRTAVERAKTDTTQDS